MCWHVSPAVVARRRPGPYRPTVGISRWSVSWARVCSSCGSPMPQPSWPMGQTRSSPWTFLRWVPNSPTIAEADGLRTTVSRWQTSSGQPLERVSILADSVKSRRFVRQPCDVVYSPDGEQLVLSSSVLGACVRKVHGTPSLVGVLGGPDWEPIVLQDDRFCGVGEGSAWAIQDARASDGLATRIRTDQAVRIRIEGLPLQEPRYWSVFAAVRTAGQHTGGPICWTMLNDSSRSAQERRHELVCPPEPGIGYQLLQICLLDATTVNDSEWVELALGPAEGLDSLLLDCLMLVQHERRPNGLLELERRAPLCFGHHGHRLWMVFDETQVISWDVHEGSLATHLRAIWRHSQVLYGLSSMACLAARPTGIVAGSRMGDLYGISLETGRRESVWPGPGGETFLGRLRSSGRVGLGRNGGRRAAAVFAAVMDRCDSNGMPTRDRWSPWPSAPMAACWPVVPKTGPFASGVSTAIDSNHGSPSCRCRPRSDKCG